MAACNRIRGRGTDPVSLSQKVLQSSEEGTVELALGSCAQSPGEGPLQPAFPSHPPPHTPRKGLGL